MGILTQILRLGIILFYKITDIIFSIIYIGKKKELPPINDLILTESAFSLAHKIRSKKLKCVDVIDSYIRRIKEVQPMINAVVDERFIEAKEEARKIDDFINSGEKNEEQLAREKPLLGVPFTAKNSIAIKDMLHTSAFPPRKAVKAADDAGIVAALRKAGAIPIAATNISEICMWWETSNSLFGTTNNPYDTRRTVGGSSGGEGAIIASAGSVIGIGSDIGGSIRLPSFMNGIFGHKPTKDIAAVTGKFPIAEGKIESFGVTGPMCRYATDLLPLMKIMAEDNVHKLKLDTKVDLRNVKFYYLKNVEHLFLPSVHREIKYALKKVLEYIEKSYNVKPEEVKIKEMGQSFKIWAHKALDARVSSMASILNDNRGELNLTLEAIKWIFRSSKHSLGPLSFAIYEKLMPALDSPEHSHYLKMFDEVQKEFRDILSGDAVLIMPTLPEPAFYHNQSYLKFDYINYTCLFNILGLPVTQCPVGLSQKGLPIGLQIVSGLYNDHLSLAVATDLEKAFGGWVSPCPIPKIKNGTVM